MYYVYILKLSNDRLYTGFSTNLKVRLKDHIKGEITSTKNKRPLKLVFYAGFISKKKATDFEKYLKTMSGFAFRNKKIDINQSNLFRVRSLHKDVAKKHRPGALWPKFGVGQPQSYTLL